MSPSRSITRRSAIDRQSAIEDRISTVVSSALIRSTVSQFQCDHKQSCDRAGRSVQHSVREDGDARQDVRRPKPRQDVASGAKRLFVDQRESFSDDNQTANLFIFCNVSIRSTANPSQVAVAETAITITSD
ncbi:hypothetical protein D8S78_22375 [Natrialba swarupiae]|nr:hypothetical protein [Natrialba swarupiae]